MTTGSAVAESEKPLFSRSPHSINANLLMADSRTAAWEVDQKRPHNQSERPRKAHDGAKNREYRDHRVRSEQSIGSHHRERRHPRYQRIKPRELDHREVREYSTESRHHIRPYPRYPRARPPVVRHPRHHHPREWIVVRPYRHIYPRHRHHFHDNHIWGLLSFTAITLAILDNLNDQQQREHERALYDATTTPLGETIYWEDGNASGAVTTTREGTSSNGRYCREYQSKVNVGGKVENVYGTACRNPDGSWEIAQ
ncbi:MAG: RT0821/Lpp0805 family surface protein [Gammaproteobacteria bacterium]|nr:RT0821/Lpp0805 family surface protein [Gammaproteobacteria bacterium]